jgi:hypothetical protein
MPETMHDQKSGAVPPSSQQQYAYLRRGTTLHLHLQLQLH